MLFNLTGRSIALLVVFALASSFNVQCSVHQTEEIYNKAKEILAGFGPGKNPQFYANECEKRLNKIQSNIVARNTKSLEKAALRKLIAIGEMATKPYCDLEEFKVIFEAAKQTEAKRYIPAEERQLVEPIVNFVNAVAVERNLKCRHIYVRNFSSIYGKMGHSLKVLSEFALNLVWRQDDQDDDDYMKTLLGFQLKSDIHSIDTVYDHVRILANYDENKCNYSEMFENYVFKPCQEYNKIIGLPIMNQIAFDNLFLPKSEGYPMDPSYIPLYESIACNRACMSLIFLRQTFEREVVARFKENPPVGCEKVKQNV